MGNRRWKGAVPTLVVAAILTWLIGLFAGPFAPLLAGAVAGLLAPRRGAFLYPAAGAFAAWALWFATAAATSPLLALGRVLSAVMGLPGLGGILLPLVACLLAAVVAGLAAAGVAAIISPPAAPEPA